MFCWTDRTCHLTNSAVQCIGEAFDVDPTDETQTSRLTIKPASLKTLFNLFLKTQGNMNAPQPAEAAQPKGPSEADKREAEKLKQDGNAHMSKKAYDAAIDNYTKSIELDPENPVYYSNRAAAHSSKGDHEKAVEDSEKAIEVDPSFVKAYHRLGYVNVVYGILDDNTSRV